MEDIKEQIKIMEHKIASITADIAQFREQGHADRRVETLEFYKEYLTDELNELRKQDASH
jgi:hypothetical protein